MEQKQIITRILFSLFFPFIFILHAKAQNPPQPPQDSIQKSDSLIIIKKNITIENIDYINVSLRTYNDFVASSLFTFNYYPKYTCVDNSYKQTHTNNMGVQFGITQGLIINKWYVSLSAIYKQYTEQFNYCDAKGTKDTIYETHSNYTLVKTKTRGINEQFNNQYLNFPLMIGHLLSFQRCFFSFQAGLDINVLLHAKGMMVLENEDIQNLSQQQYHKCQLGLIAGFSAGYKIKNNYFLFLEPRLVYALTPVFKETGVNCKISSLSIFVGIRKYF